MFHFQFLVGDNRALICFQLWTGWWPEIHNHSLCCRREGGVLGSLAVLQTATLTHCAQILHIIRVAKFHAFCLEIIPSEDTRRTQLKSKCLPCYLWNNQWSIYNSNLHQNTPCFFLQPTMICIYRLVMSILVIHLLEWKDLPALYFFSFPGPPFPKLLNVSLIGIIHPG